MGLLSGKYCADTVIPGDDVRSTTNPKTAYFTAAKANPKFLGRLEMVRELLTMGGRSLVQGAIGWLWATGDMNVPIPGTRTVEQMEAITAALAFGALTREVMAELAALLLPDADDAEDRAR